MFRHPFSTGLRAMLPIMTGVIPFGIVVGTVSATIGLSFLQTFLMNLIVFAGAAQLAAMDLMSKNAASLVIVATGLVINLRFLLYSAALSPVLHEARTSLKILCAHALTDQSYAVMSANQDQLATKTDTIHFYLGTAVCMTFVWHLSVVVGYLFGNVAPTSWSLEYAVPLSFISLVIPTLRNRNYFYVAAFSGVVSLLLHGLPYRLGLLVTALISIAFAAWLTRKATPK